MEDTNLEHLRSEKKRLIKKVFDHEEEIKTANRRKEQCLKRYCLIQNQIVAHWEHDTKISQ